jgi:BlaR1 peptidase M56
MWFDGSLASVSAWITYFLQVVFAYLVTLSVCTFIQNARTRVRIWGAFLALSTGAWLFLWLPARAGNPIRLVFRSVPFPSGAALHVALPVEDLWASYLAMFTPPAGYFYVFLVLVSVLHLLLNSAQLRAVLRQAQPPTPQVQLRFRRLCLELNVDRCELGLASELRSPGTCYWWRSHVLLPAELVPHLDSDQLDDVLRHELVHARQHDYLWDRLAALGCRIVFFHPLVWLGYRHLRWERELACDYVVVQKRSDARLRYAECLTGLARWLMVRRNLPLGIGFFSSESLLAARVRALLSQPAIGSTPREAARAGVASIVATVALLLVPGLGLSLYSPIHLASLLARPRNSPSDTVRRKAAGTKAARLAFPKAPTLETPRMQFQSAEPQSINLLLGTRSLPMLDSSNAAKDTAETSSAQLDHEVGLQRSRAVWDEAPMPLARPPKWRTLVIGAITSGVGVAAGRIDVDDVDGPHKRSR